MKFGKIFSFIVAASSLLFATNATSAPKGLKDITIKTKYSTLKVNKKGYICSITSNASGKEYATSKNPSPLMSIFIDKKMVQPSESTFNLKLGIFSVTYPNGSIAKIKVQTKNSYFTLKLLSLSKRTKVEAIVWGPFNTKVKNLIGDIIGVVRDKDWVVGMMGLDDNTIPGPPVDGDCFSMHYFVHSPDPAKYPLPSKYKEGQQFSIGGGGHSDIAFYSHPEEYFQMAFGNAVEIKPEFGTAIYYNARDRRFKRTISYSLLPFFPKHRPRSLEVDPVDVDFIGSSVAVYAVPRGKGLSTIKEIVYSENLPHPTLNGKWIKDPTTYRADIAWYGSQTKLVEYANQLGIKNIQDEGMGEYYPDFNNMYGGKRVNINGKTQSIPKLTKQTNKDGIGYGLHTLCLFLRTNSSIVRPEAHKNLQTVLRTKIAKSISKTDSIITVSRLSLLAEKGTWHDNRKLNLIRVGGEIMTYETVTEKSPYILSGIKRGVYGTKITAHKSGDELVKLQVNCYHGFLPDMKLTIDYADFYADFLVKSGMNYVCFDGNESFVYQGHGYYAFAKFYRRLFEQFKAKGGKELKVMASATFGGSWHYISVLNVGGDNRMFNPETGIWGIQGKDWRNGLFNNFLPVSFGIQKFKAYWNLYDMENIQAKAIGWDATYMLGLSQGAVEQNGNKDELFKAFRIWEETRGTNLFSKEDKLLLRSPGYKFHLKKHDNKNYSLYKVKVLSSKSTSNQVAAVVKNPYNAQPLQAEIQLHDAVKKITITLEDGGKVTLNQPVKKGQHIIIKNGSAYLADGNKRKIAAATITGTLDFQKGNNNLKVEADVPMGYNLKVFTLQLVKDLKLK